MQLRSAQLFAVLVCCWVWYPKKDRADCHLYC